MIGPTVPGVSFEGALTMRTSDGVDLVADAYRPAGNEPHPVLLLRTPYGRTEAQTVTYGHPAWYARRGYVVVVQDVRGRGDSGGEWEPFKHEAADGADAIAWAADLHGANGQVGMYGFSYAGACQLLAASEAPPALRCIAPAMTGADNYDGWTYRGGALQQAFIQSWVITALAPETARRRGLTDVMRELRAVALRMPTVYDALPLTEQPLLRRDEIAPYYFEWLQHTRRGEYWERLALAPRLPRITVPALHVTGWYDIFLDGTVRNYVTLSRLHRDVRMADDQHLVIGPWHHMAWGSVVAGFDSGPGSASDIDQLQLDWFDQWLRHEAPAQAEQPVRIFFGGGWQGYSEWPPVTSSATALHLRSNGHANTLDGDGRLEPAPPPTDEDPDVFVYDPREAVPSAGGRSCCVSVLAPMGSADQRMVESLPGVLVYTGASLEDGLDVVGDVTLELYAATSAVDTDWTAKLVDVAPDGGAINVADGILRARFRRGLGDTEPIEPGRPIDYRIDLGPVGHRFAAHHCIRLEVASSNFPTYDRNLNTGGLNGEEGMEAAVTATQTVFHDAERPSRVLLPIVAASNGGHNSS